MAKYPKQQNKVPAQGKSAALERARRNVVWQAGLAVLTIVLTVIIVFSMTAAWYTNIVQTSGLVFTAEAWGFDGNIEVALSAITAAPGDEGIIHLVAENNSDDTSDVSVSISKARMAEEMQKRLYFYVDTQQTRNGELVDRVYLSNQESYTYTIFSKGELTLTETVHNDAQLKWQWVYDVLGYYVLGTENGNGSVTVSEYLRPIEYDYDEATTTFTQDASGNTVITIQTVDGTTTVEEFLFELTKTDGYTGVLTADTVEKVGDYYKIDVSQDANGNNYGVYAYLCSYAEIEKATQYDTALGQYAARAAEDPNDEYKPATYEAKLTISAQKSKNNIFTVGSLAALEDAIELGLGDVIQLTDDITIASGDRLVIEDGQRVVLDLNGHTISSQNSQIAIEAQPGSKLTVTNGDITGPGSSGYGIYATGAEVTLSRVDVTDFKYGVYVSDNNGTNAQDSRVKLVGCTMDSSVCSVMVVGNGTASAQTTQVVIEDCILRSDGITISGNGTTTGTGKWGTDIQILNSEIISNPEILGAAIYHPQKDSTLTIYNSTVSGYTAMAVKGGSVSIVDSTITGRGEGIGSDDPAFSNSGFTDTGDAVYIETNYGYEIALEISGASKLTTTYSDNYSLRVYESDANNVSVKIYSGEFDEAQPAGYIAEGSVQNDTRVIVDTTAAVTETDPTEASAEAEESSEPTDATTETVADSTEEENTEESQAEAGA